MVQSKTIREQTTEGGNPLRQATHSIGVDWAMSDVKLHNQLEKEDLLYFHILIERVACYEV